jgi:hypothetical protein
MDWDNTEASKCRWSEFFAPVFKNTDIIWDGSSNDYQGFGKVLAEVENYGDTSYVYAEWAYGSCSGCDGWEGEPTEKCIKEAMSCVSRFKDLKHLKAYGAALPDYNNDLKEFIAKYEPSTTP